MTITRSELTFCVKEADVVDRPSPTKNDIVRLCPRRRPKMSTPRCSCIAVEVGVAESTFVRVEETKFFLSSGQDVSEAVALIFVST